MHKLMVFILFLVNRLANSNSYSMKHITTNCGMYFTWNTCYERHQETVLAHMIGDYSHHTTTNTQHKLYSTIFYK